MSVHPPGRGFRDAHTHLAAGAADLSDLDLRGATPEEIVRRVAAAAAARPLGGWIRGWGWDGGSGVAMRAGGVSRLDPLAPDHPVFLARGDGHGAWLNAAAHAVLELAPPRQAVVVEEEAYDAVRKRLPPHSTEQRSDALVRALAQYATQGIVSLDDFVEPWGAEIYARLADRGEIGLAVGLWLPDSIGRHDAEAIRRAFPEGRGPLAVRGIKIFLDGTLGARTAALSRPYEDRPDWAGTLRMDESEAHERVAHWAHHGWPLALHAIGDRAVSVALDALAAAPRSPRGSHRVEHVQVVKRSDLPRFAAGAIIASVQPGHWRDDLPFLAQRLGAPSDRIVHPLASLARSGATLLFGSDWPVSPSDPATIIAAATDHRRREEALGGAEALAAASA